MATHKLYLRDFNPNTGTISFAMEDDNGDRIGTAGCMDKCVCDITSMDYFLITCYTAYLYTNITLEIMGPVSKGLFALLDPLINLKVGELVDNMHFYTIMDLENIKKYFFSTNDMNDVLTYVVEYFKGE